MIKQMQSVRLVAKFATAIVGVVCVAPLWAAQLPWLSIPQTGSVNVSYVTQSADQYWRGDTKVDAGFGEIDHTTTWLSANFAISDSTELDFTVGNADISAGSAGDSKGTTDVTFGVTRQVFDEATSELGSHAFRVGIIAKGDYDIGGPWGLGDGGNGIELSWLAGRFVQENLGIAGELMYRKRTNNIPDEFIFNVNALYLVSDTVTAYGRFSTVISNGDLDIGGEGFAPSRFPEVQEEASIIRVGGAFSALPELTIEVAYEDVLGGRNTADYSTFLISGTYTFDFFK